MDHAARRPPILYFTAFTHLGLAKAVRLFTASLHTQLTGSQMCTIDISVDLQPGG